jgi:hypothetical protein
MKTFNWGSRCAECGKVMKSGLVRKCEKGGHCSWYIPTAIREVVAEIYEALKRADTLLVAIQGFIVDNDLEEFAVDYDEVTNDGNCLRDHANFAVTDIRAALAKADRGQQ